MAARRSMDRPGARYPVAPGVGLAMALALLSGCSTSDRMAAVPRDLSTAATIPGMAKIRYYIDLEPEDMFEAGYRSVVRERKHLAAIGHRGPLPPAVFLAISGGGDNGAFGAGLLVGWTAAGNRPAFKIVTGISTGALIAPFAFLGPAYDPILRRLYTTMTADDIFTERNLLYAIFSDAMTDSTPPFGLVERYADQEMLDAIAREHAKGRILLVATTDLDARQPVVWDIGAIAASGDLFKIYLDAERDNVDYDLAFVGADFTVAHPRDFDTNYMRALFDYGFDRSRQGSPWKKYPPGFTPNT